MKRTKYPIHPDFKKWENMNPPLNRTIDPANVAMAGDSGILHAERLQQFGVSSELYNTKGTMHGFDIVLDSQSVRGCVDRRITFLRREFAAR